MDECGMTCKHEPGCPSDDIRRWLVPPSHRPTCPLDGHPCTSWTCLVDVCVDAKKETKPEGAERDSD